MLDINKYIKEEENKMNDRHDIAVIINSQTPLISIKTREEKRALELLKSIRASVDRGFYQWKITEGLTSLMFAIEADAESIEPAEVLLNIKKQNLPGVFILIDFQHHLKDPVHVRLIKDIVYQFESIAKTLIFLGVDCKLPDELRSVTANFELTLPSTEEIEKIVKQEAKKWANKNGKKVKSNRKNLAALIKNLNGLSRSEVKRLARGAIYDDGAINESDLPDVMQAKYQLLNQDGILHFEYETEKFSAVGGFANLKKWLEQRRNAFNDSQQHDRPKGVLLLGVQGCGKSLAAKSVAGVWGLPLLRLDFAALYNKYHGESEKNLRQSLKAAETMAPCVLWIDEMEKGFSSSDSDGGTSKRLLGTFLTWLAENKKHVFLVATANDIQSLPPELIRKGRMDEIFFVDLPDAKTRENIFSIHLRKRDLEITDFNLKELAQVSQGFSGAEIEQALVSALYAMAAATLKTTDIVKAINNTKPLSIVMDKQISALRAWAQSRTVPAN